MYVERGCVGGETRRREERGGRYRARREEDIYIEPTSQHTNTHRKRERKMIAIKESPLQHLLYNISSTTSPQFVYNNSSNKIGKIT
jgi:hypothetical protein